MEKRLVFSGPERHIQLVRAFVVMIALNTSPLYAQSIMESVRAVEGRLDARVGVFVLNTGTGETFAHRADDRFPMNSTFKTLACAALLAKVDGGEISLSDVVIFTWDDIVPYSPVTTYRVGVPGMTVGEICQTTLAVSDNTAGNLVLEAIGGPAGLTAFLRSVGDDVTRLDRWETALNESTPGDERDTTTPRAMAHTMQALVLGDVLSPDSRRRLEDWIVGHELGDALIRSSVPASWRVGDRTGAGGYGSRSIAAIMWPTDRDPIVMTVYITETEASFNERNAAIAEIGRAVVSSMVEIDEYY